jgi:hypothetical protein
MTMEWALMELLRRLDAAAVATEELYRVVSPTGGGELGGRRCRGAQWRPAQTSVAPAAALS